jgi:hypothetical protein
MFLVVHDVTISEMLTWLAGGDVSFFHDVLQHTNLEGDMEKNALFMLKKDEECTSDES